MSDTISLSLPEDRSFGDPATRLRRFRDAVSAIGDAPTREQLDEVVTLAQTFGLGAEEVAEDVHRVKASVAATALRDEIAIGRLPVVEVASSLPAGDVCHFAAPVRTGPTDQDGRVLLTSSWLRFRGINDLSIAWTQVDDVRRCGSDLIVSVGDRSRECRLSFERPEDAARCGVLAAHLTDLARTSNLAAGARSRMAAMPAV